jgi:hypothetical protein
VSWKTDLPGGNKPMLHHVIVTHIDGMDGVTVVFVNQTPS